jgi:tRNA A-37 threonylcarbamoyl transferase component Bud32
MAGRTTDSARRMWTLIREEHRCALLDELIKQPASVMARGRVLKHDAVTTVVEVGDGERRWVVKRYNTKNRWHAVRRALRTSRAVNCWHAADRLRQAGIDTPRPVAVLEERLLGILRGRSWFIHEYVDGETLDQALLHTGGDRSALVSQATDIVMRLRRAGIVHGDLKATNFLVSGEHIYLLDLDATRRLRGRRLEAGLHRDQQRFMRNWSERPELAEMFRKELGIGVSEPGDRGSSPPTGGQPSG